MKHDPDGYPAFKEDGKWFMELIESMVSNPDKANLGRVKAGNDLEVRIYVAEEDRDIFTDDVCADLEEKLKERTGLMAPVVYLDGQLTEHARQARHDAQDY